MSDIIKIIELDWKSGLLFIAGLIILAVFLFQKTDWLVERFGFTSRRKIAEEKRDKEIHDLEEHAEKMDKSFEDVCNRIEELKSDVKELAVQVNNLQNRFDENETSKIGDRLTQSFVYYNAKGQWTSMEKWAFDNLAKQYLKSGGDSYAEEIIIPKSKQWEIIDD